MEPITELWAKVSPTQPDPGPWVVLGTAAVALALVVLAWPVVRLPVTICHEAGHALVARLAGRKLSGIRVHADTSGLTTSKGRPTGPGMMLTLAAGYPAASLVGLGVAALTASGRSPLALWLLVVLLALTLTQVRNIYGILAVLGGGVALALASWFIDGPHLAWLGYTLSWLLLLAGPRPVLELFRPGSAGSDAAQLARLTRVPQFLWRSAWLMATAASLALGASWLLAPLLRTP